MEHKAFIKDLTYVVISYTPASGIVDTIKFSHKWFGKKRSIRRTIKHVRVLNRKSFIKNRSRKIKESYKRLGRMYHLGAGESPAVISRIRETYGA